MEHRDHASSEPQALRPGVDRHLALLVIDVETIRRTLEQAGVQCITSRSGRAAVFCRDPDGNALEFIARVLA